MTPQTVSLVQHSFRKVVPMADTAADLFYARVFALAPEARALFPDDMAAQKTKLMQMLATAVQNLHKPETVVPVVRDLGHVGYGVAPAHYAIVGEALMDTLAQGLGEEWTPEIAEAWRETYETIAKVMLEGAAEATA